MGVCSGMARGVAAGVAGAPGVGRGGGRVGVMANVGAGVAVRAGVAAALGEGAGMPSCAFASRAGVAVGVGSSEPHAATRARMAIMTKAMAAVRHPGVRLGRRYRCTVVSPFEGCLWEWGYIIRLGVVRGYRSTP